MSRGVRGLLSQESGFSLLELLVAVTITALLSTAVIASFRIGISSMRRGEDFLDRSQRLSAAVDLIQKQIGSANPLFPDHSMNVVAGPNKRSVQVAQDAPAFLGNSRELVFVTDYPLASRAEGGMQLVHYTIGVAPGNSGPGQIGVVHSRSVTSQAVVYELRMTSAAIFRREDFLNLAGNTGQEGRDSMALLEGVQDITFQYWGEQEVSSQDPSQPVVRKMLAFDQWDGETQRRLPEAVSIKARFAAASTGRVENSPYNRDSLDLLIPINVVKSD